MMWMGIDGGGSTLRIVLLDDALQIHASVEGEAVNPSSVGHAVASERIREGMIHALKLAGIAHDVAGIGMGIAGAAADHSEAWLRTVAASVLPGVRVVPSSDIEIALVGARGQLDGLVLLAGTGSVAYGINPDGQKLRAGGWGYLLGDEGSGHWIGLQALKLMTYLADQRQKNPTPLTNALMKLLDFSQPQDVVRWTYHNSKPADVAKLATVVLEQAENGDPSAQKIITDAAKHLAQLAEHIRTQLELSRESIVYAGGLLASDTLLSKQVTRLLHLDTTPQSLYSPVVGAALLAKLTKETS